MSKIKKYDTVIFDLDGTLLNTLDDLMDSVNAALAKELIPLRSKEEIRTFVGNGVVRLMELAVPGGKENPKFDSAFSYFKEHYSKHCNDKTDLYPNIKELLAVLKEQGYKMAIVSNKYYDAVQELNKLYFNEYISVAIGEKENIRKKPAPDTVIEALEKLGSKKEMAVYVGDSEVDIATASHVGMDCIVVTWGFRTKEEQKKAGGKWFADDPMEIINYL